MCISKSDRTSAAACSSTCAIPNAAGCDARDVEPARITEAPTVCFIDGEHTAEAVRSDFSFCIGICDADAAIVFHDAQIVMAALRAIVADLQRRQVPFAARKVCDAATFVLFLRDCPARDDPFFRDDAEDGIMWLRRERWRMRAQAAIRWVHPVVSPITPRFARRLASRIVHLTCSGL